MASLDWDDLRHAMAIATAGSLAGAARALGVNHTTVLRRLDALEGHLGSRLFDRHRTGYQATEAGLALLGQARHMAARAEEIERRVLGHDRELTGALRVATAFVVMDHLLPQPLADFSRRYPGIGHSQRPEPDYGGVRPLRQTVENPAHAVPTLRFSPRPPA